MLKEDNSVLRARAKALRAVFQAKGSDAFLVTDLKNIRYLTGFTGSSAYLVVAPDKNWFLTDSRYATQAREEVKGCKVRIFKKALDSITGIIKEQKIKNLAFEGNNLSFDNYTKIKKAFSGVRLKPLTGEVNRLRQRKSPFEIERIRDSAWLLDKGYEAAGKLLRHGAVEKEAAFSIEAGFRMAGAEGLAFDTIIASGPRGALPHGKASEKAIKKGELVVVDMGVLLNGYNSDETRTFCVGRPTAEQRKVYQTVLDAQSKAIGKIRPGVKASEVDLAARMHIEKAGYGKYFGHGTGHGVGLDIHEGPVVGPTSPDTLEEGMIITIEPGIYIPGWGGVRIEDMALVVKNGFELLTKTSKELVSL